MDAYRDWYSLFLFQLFGPLERAKYYAIWTLTEARLPSFPYFFFSSNLKIDLGCQYFNWSRLHWIFGFRQINMGRCC